MDSASSQKFGTVPFSERATKLSNLSAIYPCASLKISSHLNLASMIFSPGKLRSLSFWIDSQICWRKWVKSLIDTSFLSWSRKRDFSWSSSNLSCKFYTCSKNLSSSYSLFAKNIISMLKKSWMQESDLSPLYTPSQIL